jgi:hypothetical protein
MIKSELKAVNGLTEYILRPDDNGWLTSIKIIRTVKTPARYSSRIDPGTGPVKANIVIEGDRKEYLELIREFQELESLLSFSTNGNLKNIDWDSPKEEFIPETDEERKRVHVSSFAFTKEYPDIPVSLSEQEFETIINTKERYASLMVPKAFYKEGINEFTSRRYINAFYNFYFILEDIYGKGKTKNKDISETFRQSKDLIQIIEWTLKDVIGKNKRHSDNIKNFCVEERVTYDVTGIIDLLQRIRGNLHHYSSKSSKHLGTPFTHEDFESIAFLTMCLALQTILRKIADINQLSMMIEKEKF